MAVSAILVVKLLQIPSPCETCILKESGDNVLGVIVMSPSWSCASYFIISHSGWGNGI